MYATQFLLCLFIDIVLSSNQRNVVKTLTVPNPVEQLFGAWHGPQYCAGNMFAQGFQLKVQPWQAGHGDDSGLNAIRLFCGHIHDYDMYGGYIESGEGPDGSFYERRSCKPGEYLVGFELNVQPNQYDKDDAAAINAKFWCRKFQGGEEHPLDHPFLSHENTVGQWTGYSGNCPPNTAICGMRTKIDNNGYQGLVDADFYCCTA